MDRVDDDFKTYAELFRAAVSAQDRDDYNHAVSGADVGRQRRHVFGSDIDPVTGEKRDVASRTVERMLDWLLANDLAYARAHEAAMGALVEAESAVSDGLGEIVAALSDARDGLAQMEDRAARLPDGTLVFRDAQGNIVDADGNVVSEEDAESITWRGDEPNYEEYRAQRQRIERLENAERELRGMEVELGDIRGELNDQRNPPSPPRLGELEDRAGELEDRAQQLVPSAHSVEPSGDARQFTQEGISPAAVPIIPVGG